MTTGSWFRVILIERLQLKELRPINDYRSKLAINMGLREVIHEIAGFPHYADPVAMSHYF